MSEKVFLFVNLLLEEMHIISRNELELYLILNVNQFLCNKALLYPPITQRAKNIFSNKQL